MSQYRVLTPLTIPSAGDFAGGTMQPGAVVELDDYTAGLLMRRRVVEPVVIEQPREVETASQGQPEPERPLTVKRKR